MAYQPVELGRGVPALVERVIRKTIEPILNDVHCALRLPMRRPNLPAGFNFTIGHTLLALVAGVSATFYRRGLTDGKAFTGLLVEFYPWALEPNRPVDKQQSAKILWETFRNPFTHSLGMPFEKQNRGSRELKPRDFVVKVGRDKNGMKEREVVALERSIVRPDLNPTLVVTPQKRVLLVEPLYWGVRQMLFQLTQDPVIMRNVEEYFSRAIAKHQNRPV